MVVVAIALGALLILALVALARQQFSGPSLVKKTVVVHTKDERTIRGVLLGEYADRVTLTEAVVMTSSASEQPLGGLQHVPINNVSFMQEILPPSGDSE
jgi:hypothetical protein